MYIITTLKEFDAYCYKDYEYFDMRSGKTKLIIKGESVTMLYTKYVTDNIDKVVSYDYIIKEDKSHIRIKDFPNYFMNIYDKRKEIAKNILKYE
jgi:hypothetical protein